MPRILLLTAYFAPEKGGIQTYLEGLFSSLNHEEISVLAPSDRADLVPLESPLNDVQTSDASFPYSIQRVSLFGSRGPLRVRAQKRALVAHIEGFSPDVIVVGHFLYSFAEAAVAAGRKKGIPVVQLVHGYDLLDELKRSSRRVARVRKLLASMRRIVVTTDYMRSRVAHAFELPNEAFSVLAPGITPVPKSSPQQWASFLEVHGLTGHRVVLSVGRPVPRKGQDMLLRAFPAVVKQFPDVRLLIAGSGDNAWLKALATELGIADFVVFTGELSQEDLHVAYRSADVFCMPNREDEGGDVEGFGIVFLEAMSAGLPVVGGRSGGVPEAIHEQVNGLLVDGSSAEDISKALLHLLSDSETAEAFRAAGAKTALDSSWDRRAKSFLDLLT